MLLKKNISKFQKPIRMNLWWEEMASPRVYPKQTNHKSPSDEAVQCQPGRRGWRLFVWYRKSTACDLIGACLSRRSRCRGSDALLEETLMRPGYWSGWMVAVTTGAATSAATSHLQLLTQLSLETVALWDWHTFTVNKHLLTWYNLGKCQRPTRYFCCLLSLSLLFLPPPLPLP